MIKDTRCAGRRQVVLAVAKDKRYALRSRRQVALAVAKDKRCALYWHDSKDKSCRLDWYDGMWDCMMGCGIVSCLCCVWYLNFQYDREGNGVSWECRARAMCEGSAREWQVGKHSNIECILSRFTK